MLRYNYGLKIEEELNQETYYVNNCEKTVVRQALVQVKIYDVRPDTGSSVSVVRESFNKYLSQTRSIPTLPVQCCEISGAIGSATLKIIGQCWLQTVTQDDDLGDAYLIVPVIWVFKSYL